MTRYIVSNVYDGLNLRETPSTSGKLVTTMKFATVVTLLEDTSSKWKKVQTEGPGQKFTGFASDVFLTKIESDAVARLIESAAFYWDLFDRGAGRENVEPYKSHVLKMWDDLGQGRPPGDNTSHPKWPWSAAGMSAFVRRAGGYTGFKFNAGHSLYINDSIVKKFAGQQAPFWGFRIKEKKPEVGDLIAQWRKKKIDYDFARAHTQFTSHTDVVCQVKGDSVRAIGANVPTDTVNVKVYKLDANGFLAGDRNEIAIMKNMAQ